jgi:hypothetical protein
LIKFFYNRKIVNLIYLNNILFPYGKSHTSTPRWLNFYNFLSNCPIIINSEQFHGKTQEAEKNEEIKRAISCDISCSAENWALVTILAACKTACRFVSIFYFRVKVSFEIACNILTLYRVYLVLRAELGY